MTDDDGEERSAKTMMNIDRFIGLLVYGHAGAVAGAVWCEGDH